MSPKPRNRGQSGEEFSLTVNGVVTGPLGRRAAMSQGKTAGDAGKTVEVRRLRPGASTVLVAAWENGVKIK